MARKTWRAARDSIRRSRQDGCFRAVRARPISRPLRRGSRARAGGLSERGEALLRVAAGLDHAGAHEIRSMASDTDKARHRSSAGSHSRFVVTASESRASSQG
jgi:hypothetical protein